MLLSFLILILFFGSSIYISYAAISNNNSNVNVDTVIEGEEDNQIKIRQTSSSEKSLKPSITEKDRSFSLYNNQFNANIEVEDKQSPDGFTYVYNETETGNFDLRVNNDNITLTPITSLSKYDTSLLNVTTASYKQTFGGTTGSTFQGLSDQASIAQSLQLDQLNSTYLNSKIILDNINLGAVAISNNVELTMEVWSARDNTTHLVPNTSLASSSVTVSGNPSVVNFDYNNISISQSDTYFNDTAGYIFIVIYRTDNNGALSANFQADDDDASTITFFEASSTPPSGDNWDQILTLNLNFSHDSSFVFQSNTLNTNVASPKDDPGDPVDSRGLYINTTTVTSATEYRVYHTRGVPGGLTLYFNISYVTFALKQDLATVSYKTSPESTTINWTIFYDETLTFVETADRYFLLPGNMTNIDLFIQMSLMTENTHYTITSGPVNQTLMIEPTESNGNYTITGFTSNLLYHINPSTEKFNTVWEKSNNATMGVLVPSSAVGDRIKSDNTLPGTFNGTSIATNDGKVNASLRTQNGQILFDGANGPESGYNYTALYDWNNTLIFETVLDPDIPIGYYTYQFRWFNGTAAGAIAVEIEIHPVTVIETFSHAQEFNALEGDMVDLEFATLDLSHDDNWSISNQLISAFENTSLSYDREILSPHRFIYSVTLDLSIISNSLIRPQKYLLNYSMTESVHTNFLETNISIFYRGDTSYELGQNVAPNPEYGNDFYFWISPLNATSPNSDKRFNIGTPAEFVVEYSNSTDTIDISSTLNSLRTNNATSYNFTVPWQDDFELGSNNQFEVMWNLSDFRETADDAFVHQKFNVTIIDSTAPFISDSPGDTIQRTEGNVENFPLVWQVSDLFLMNYTLTRDGTEVDTGSGLSGSLAVPAEINYELPALSKGTYTYELTVEDENGVTSSHIVTLTVLDIVDPSLSSSPGNLSLAIANYSNTLSWTFSDTNPDKYQVLVDDSINAEGSWTSGSPIQFDIGGLSDGSHKVEIKVNDTSNNSANDIVYINIDQNAPSISDIEDFRIFDNQENENISWSINDNFPNNYVVYKNGTPVDNGQWTSGVNVTILLGSLTVGIYNYTIEVFDISGNSATDTVIVTVKPQGIIETDQIENLTIETQVYEGDVDKIGGTWTLFLEDTGVSNANISVRLFQLSDNDIIGSFLDNSFVNTTNEEGSYILLLNYEGLTAGSYRWIIEFMKNNHENQTVTQDVEVFAHSIEISLTYSPTLTRGEPYTIAANVRYTTFDTSLLLSSLISRRSGAAAGINVTFIINYTTLDGNDSQIVKVGITDGEGFVSITLSSSETEGMREINGISASVTNVGYITATTKAAAADTLPSIQDPQFNLNDFIREATDFLSENWQYILAGLLGLMIVISLITSQLRRRRRRIDTLNRELETAIEEVNGIIDIQAIIMKNTDTGIPFYYQTFEEEEDSLDLSLIASLTTAISTFLSELQEGSTGFETMEREGISLTSHRGECSDFIVISKSPLPLAQFEQIKNSHLNIELEYREDINNPLMIQEIADEDVARILINHGMKIDLKGYLTIDANQIDKIMNKSSISKSIRQNMEFLHELAESIQEANVPVNLSSILEFLISKELSPEISARVILVAYNHDVVKKFEESKL